MAEQIKIQGSLAQLATEKCACGNESWEKTYVLKKVPGLMIGQSAATLMPVEMYRCDNCKVLHPDFKEIMKKINGEEIKKLNS